MRPTFDSGARARAHARPLPRLVRRRLSRLAAGSHLVWTTLLPLAARAATFELPLRSPPGHVFAHVGLTDLTVAYDSPAARGRAIWGEAVSYGRPWRGSESPAAQLAVGKAITFGETVVEPGTYAVVLIPGRESWVVALSRDLAYARGGGVYLPSQEVARVAVPVVSASPRERLAFSFSDATHERVTLDFDWAGVHLAVPIALHTREQLEAGLRELDTVPTSYAEAARYMLEVRRDYETGLRYIDNALALERSWQNLLIKSALLAAKGDKREARALNAQAYELRRARGDEPLPGPEKVRTVATTSPGRLSRTALVQQARPPVAVPHEELPTDSIGVALPSFPGELGERAAPAVAAREPRNLRPLGPAEIGRILERGRDDIQSCYQQALRKDPSFTRAKISTSVTVGLSGRARTIVLESPTGLGTIEPCLKEIIGHWSFPVSTSEYEVQFPLALRGRN